MPIDILGTPESDSLIGTLADENIYGLAGDDTLDGGGGNDTLDGGDGDDQLYFAYRYGSPETGIAIGGIGNDTIWLSARDIMSIDGGAGTDILAFQQPFLPFGPGRIFDLTGLWSRGTGYINGTHPVTSIEALDTRVWGSSYDDNMTIGAGNMQSLVIYGLSGNDRIVGGSGADIVIGGDGNDFLDGGLGADILIGGTGDDILSGGFGANEFYGGAGNDVLVFASNSPADAVLNVIYEVPGGGVDEVRTTASIFSLDWYGASEVENLTVFDSAPHAAIIGNAFNNIITGNIGADSLFGRAGNDTLRGGSGAANTLVGNEGDDTYIIEALGDTVVEFAGQGTDIVKTELASFVLSANVEQLVNTGIGAFTGVGNAQDNILTGGIGTDSLFGGPGNDILYGGAFAANTLAGNEGDDIFIVEAAGDSVVELAGQGMDTVRTPLTSFTLQANVENLTATGTAGLVGTGNAQDNVITGGMGGDTLFGGVGNDRLIGGAGAANTLNGGQGDDIFVVSAAGDTVIEAADDGLDTIETTLHVYTLPNNVEILTMTHNGYGTGIGNALDNVITGNGLHFTLRGLDGNDILSAVNNNGVFEGGNGADQFHFAAIINANSNIVRILDLVSGIDKIMLSGAANTHTAEIDLVQSANPVAVSTNSTFLNYLNNGIVSYDPDGAGPISEIYFAQLNPGQTLTVTDFGFY
jgi:Ca2+-binding RTX toxin-like protein